MHYPQPTCSRNACLTYAEQEDKTRMQKLVTREYEEVMNMMREVFLYQVRLRPLFHVICVPGD